MHAIMNGASGDSGAEGKLQMIEAEVARLTSLVSQLAARNGAVPGGVGVAVAILPSR